jgi:hypothetical protein
MSFDRRTLEVHHDSVSGNISPTREICVKSPASLHRSRDKVRPVNTAVICVA